jgi:hypothetical protein
MSTGITGSQPRLGDPSGAGTLTQRLSVVLRLVSGPKSTLGNVVDYGRSTRLLLSHNKRRNKNGNRNIRFGDRGTGRGVSSREGNHPPRASRPRLLDGSQFNPED